jgi:hypothetical protein
MGINMHNGLEALGGVETPTYKNFWNWARRTFTVSYQDEVQYYLEQSADTAELENRMKLLQKRGML